MIVFIFKKSMNTINMEQFLKNTKLTLNELGKIKLPNVKHIKLDIGLSYNAPHSFEWLKKEDSLLVFGFEPNPKSLSYIENIAGKSYLLNYLNSSLFVIPCALGLENTTVKLYSTSNDVGCSSLFEPISLPVDSKFEVPCYTLKSFFDIFPFEQYPIIEYIKVDAQGSDLDIIKGGGEYIKEHVVIITMEADGEYYHNTKNSESDIESYMISIGFERIKSDYVRDPTYVNTFYKDLAKDIYFEQFT
jgi:FkbM family methyltransferase